MTLYLITLRLPKFYGKVRKRVFTSGLFLCLLIPFALIAAKKTTKANIDPQTVLQQGREAFLDYRFDDAADLYEEYRNLMKKAKKDVAEELEDYERTLDIARSAFDRVQKIVIIDSISLPRDKFYSSYRLANSAGSIKNSGNLKSRPKELNANTPVFTSGEQDRLIWAQNNGDGEQTLIEGLRLLDGSWVTHEIFQEDYEKSGNYAYPFMLSDGQTFYFANDGEESMGGYDIFVAQRDARTGEFLQPLNLGMPFNSPYDDLLMAIDEEHGIGWWATDRNSPDGNVTVFVYLLNEIRQNYPSSTENLADFAKISDIKLTQDSTKTSEYKSKILNLKK